MERRSGDLQASPDLQSHLSTTFSETRVHLCSGLQGEALISNPKWVARTPVLTTLLLEGANLQQLHRMWTEHSSVGQSVWGWLQVNIALWLWFNFYRVITPDAKWAIRGTALGILLNGAVILSVLYFRYLV